MSTLLDSEPDKVGLVVSSRPDAYGLTNARRLGFETLVLDKKINWNQLLETLSAKNITHIFLLGFMKIVSKEFLLKWNKPILNLHPSLLPKYPGLKSVERAVADKADIGVTVHKVIADVDAGDIIAQEKVFSFDEYSKLSFEQLESRVHETEHRLVRRVCKEASCWT